MFLKSVISQVLRYLNKYILRNALAICTILTQEKIFHLKCVKEISNVTYILIAVRVQSGALRVLLGALKVLSGALRAISGALKALSEALRAILRALRGL